MGHSSKVRLLFKSSVLCGWALVVALPSLCSSSSQATSAPSPNQAKSEVTPPAQKPAPVYRTVPAGDRLQVRMIDGIDSKKNTPGQTFRATLDTPLTVGDRVVVPAGSPATVMLESAKSAGRVKGSSELELRVTSVRVRGRSYQVASTVYEQSGKSRGKQTAVRTGLGAGAGALIGGLAGGGKGAAIGAAAGGGTAVGYQALTHGPQVKVAPESVLTFQLSAPLRVRI